MDIHRSPSHLPSGTHHNGLDFADRHGAWNLVYEEPRLLVEDPRRVGSGRVIGRLGGEVEAGFFYL